MQGLVHAHAQIFVLCLLCEFGCFLQDMKLPMLAKTVQCSNAVKRLLPALPLLSDSTISGLL